MPGVVVPTLGFEEFGNYYELLVARIIAAATGVHQDKSGKSSISALKKDRQGKGQKSSEYYPDTTDIDSIDTDQIRRGSR